MENNIYFKWLNLVNYDIERYNELLQEFYQNNPGASFEEAQEAAKDIYNRTMIISTDPRSEKESLAIQCAIAMGTSEEEIKSMIEDLQNRGFNYIPTITEKIKDIMTTDVRIKTDAPDERIPNPNINPEDTILNTEVATYIFDSVSAEEKYAKESIDSGRTR